MIQEKVKIQEMPQEVDDAVIPIVWNTEIPGKSKTAGTSCKGGIEGKCEASKTKTISN